MKRINKTLPLAFAVVCFLLLAPAASQGAEFDEGKAALSE